MSLNFHTEEEDNYREESLNKYKNLFSKYENNPPSLKEALNQIYKSTNIENKQVDILTEDIINKCKGRIDPNIDDKKKKYNNITKEDAYIICSYTCESEQKEYSPYRILNKSLVSDNRQHGIRNISKYLYIFINSLRKLPRYYPKNKYLYRCLTCKVNISKDSNNENLIPYVAGNKKTFWGFTSTSVDPKMTYSFLKEEEKMKKGTIFSLGGDIWGYNIEPFNYFYEKEIIMEPERKFVVDNVLPPVNGIINITCTILKTPLIKTNNFEDNKYIHNEINNNNDDSIIKKYVIKFEMEAKIKEKDEYTSGIGILCNIPSKKIKALITFNHMINIDFLNKTKKMELYINDKEIEIDMKKNRYKYTNKDLNITIIEILAIDKINIFVDIDKYINSKNYTESNIIYVSLNKNGHFDLSYYIIKEKIDDNYICSKEFNKEGIIILKEKFKLLGMAINNKIIPMNIIINKINFIKCIYNIKKEDSDKDIQIINNRDILCYNENNEIEKEIKVIIDGEIKSNILTYKFFKEGIQNIYLISNNDLTNMSFMFYNCSSLQELDLSSFNTNLVTNMSSMFHDCLSLKELDLSSFNTNLVTNMSCMFSFCSSLKKLDLSSFNTYQVTDMSDMFKYCTSLKELNLSTFNTNKVTNMSNMFYNCCSLKELDLSSFNTNKVSDMSYMFADCDSLKELDLSLINTSQVTDMSWMFNRCDSLKKLNLSSFKTNNVTNMKCMFNRCYSLKELDLSLFNTDQETDISSIFNYINKSCNLKCKDDKILKEFTNQTSCIII